MIKPKIAVQFLFTSNQNAGLLIEQLRYMGLLRIVGESNSEGTTEYVLQAAPHAGVDAEVWARQNSDRMKSFGINAVVAKVP